MIPLFSVNQVRAADNYAITKLQISGEILMENAAISITEAIIQKYPYLDHSYTFGIICGKGNNGGDGFTLARHLLIKGFSVIVLSLAKVNDLNGDALINFKILKNFIKDYKNSSLIYYNSLRDLQKIGNCDILVDAILGTGSFGELKEPYKSIVNKLNELQALKISIDTPTGLNLNCASGEVIFKSDLTITLAEMKTGLFYEKGKGFSGKVIKGSIGIGHSYFNTITTNDFLIEPEDALNGLPKKNINLQKYSAGKVLVIAGSSNMPGAAIFSMNAAMVSGAGAGKLVFPDSIKVLAQSQMNSAIVFSYDDDSKGVLALKNLQEFDENILWSDSIAIGPGLGRDQETKKAVISLLEKFSNKIFIIDADAINAISKKKYKKIDLAGNVFTPHHKEFADLLGIELAELNSKLLFYGRKFTKETKAYLVLKGAPTIIFNPFGEVFINSTGNPGLAKFGSGDVLTGFIASFIAQNNDIEKSIISAVYLHSLTADLLLKKESEYGMLPQKLIDNFCSTVKFLRKSIV